MKLHQLAAARRYEKQLARTVGAHLAHMIYLYAQELWDSDKELQRQYHDFEDFWNVYSSYKWKEEGWLEKFMQMAQQNLKQAITAENIKTTMKMIAEKKLLDVPTMTPEQLAKHHKVDIEHINRQLKKGIKAELEHTTDKKIAREIALDHLKEDPNYYTKLEKMERS